MGFLLGLLIVAVIFGYKGSAHPNLLILAGWGLLCFTMVISMEQSAMDGNKGLGDGLLLC